MQRFKKVLFLVVFSLFLSAGLNAGKIGLLPFKSTIIENNINEAIYQLIESELSAYGHIVVPPDEIEKNLGETVECYNKQCAAEIGTQLGLEKVILGSVTKLGEKYIISALVIESQSGDIVFSDKASSTTPEHLDTCLSGLLKAIEKGIIEEKTAEVNIVTDINLEKKLAECEKRKKVFFSVGLEWGYTTPLKGYGDGHSPNHVAAVKFWAETQRFAAALDWDGYESMTGYDNYNQLLSLSFIYFFTTSDFSPFVSAGVGWEIFTIGTYEGPTGYSYYDYDEATAFELGGGLVMFRTYHLRLVLDGKLSTTFKEIGVFEGPHSALRLGFSAMYKF